MLLESDSLLLGRTRSAERKQYGCTLIYTIYQMFFVEKSTRVMYAQGRSPCDTASMDGSAHLKGGDGIGSSQQQQAGDAAKRHSQQVEHGEGRRGSAELSSTGREAAGKEFSLAGRQSSAATTAYEAGPSAGLTPRAPLISGSETMTVHSRSPFDAAALQSCAVQPSETNALDHLTDQGDILGDPLESRDVLVGSSQVCC